MKTYAVGGMVRDQLLGLPAVDDDFVVVGATVADMLAAGFTPVGRDFPVFLHPHTHASHALARTERKKGRGHQGFVFHAAPDISLEEDLRRRDLTINAMARNLENGHLIDPYGGVADLQAKVLRHVSPAFVEDPLRVLRVARFAARFSDFSVAPETIALMQSLVASGELAALSAERVWQELARGLLDKKPTRMLEVLADCGALAALWPHLAHGWARLTADFSARLNRPSPPPHTTPEQGEEALAAQFSLLCLLTYQNISPANNDPTEEGTAQAALFQTDFSNQRLPRFIWQCALSALRLTPQVAQHHKAPEAEQFLSWLDAADAWRAATRWQVLLACWQRLYPHGLAFARWEAWRNHLATLPFPQAGLETDDPLARATLMRASRLAALATFLP